MLKNRWTNYLVVRELGFVGYGIFDAGSYLKKWLLGYGIEYVDPGKYRDFLLSRRAEANAGPGKGVAAGKNLVYLQLEGIDQLLLRVRRNGEPVMPFLSSLAKSSLYF